jgi:hypothetical protein
MQEYGGAATNVAAPAAKACCTHAKKQLSAQQRKAIMVTGIIQGVTIDKNHRDTISKHRWLLYVYSYVLKNMPKKFPILSIGKGFDLKKNIPPRPEEKPGDDDAESSFAPMFDELSEHTLESNVYCVHMKDGKRIEDELAKMFGVYEFIKLYPPGGWCLSIIEVSLPYLLVYLILTYSL